MNILRKISIPLWLSITAIIVSFYGVLQILWDIPSVGFNMFEPQVVFLYILPGIMTFLFSDWGLRGLKTNKPNSIWCAAIGFMFGLATLLAVVVLTTLATRLAEPSFDGLWTTFEITSRLGFKHGGFLAPFVGALVAYFVSRKRDLPQVFV